MLIYALIALIIGFVLDLWWGDPQNFPHLIRLMGKMIAKLEKWLRHLFPTNETGERTAGKILVFLIGITWLLIPLLLVLVAYGLSPWLGLGVEALFCWQLLATKSLMTESGKVYNSLLRGDLPQARQDVAMIVGRDTENLDLAGVTKATVETVAENVADGVVAPLFYLMLGGSCLGALYKAINTMDSMVGYKNAVYLDFGRAAAKLDDVANYIPSRLAAVLMIGAAALAGLDAKRALKIWRRDRGNHASPNSAQTEAVAAGALQLQLAGDAYYFGQLCHKPTIGDPLRQVEAEDICRSHKLLRITAWLMLLLAVVVRLIIIIGWWFYAAL